jgi:hypothetical protein
MMVGTEHRKAPPKPYTISDGERRIRSFVLRRATRTPGHEAFQRVATRRPNPLAGGSPSPYGGEPTPALR